MPQHDQLHRYLFENFAVRGELVTVSETLQQILENHDYPQPVKNVLAELLVATSLLTATLKFDGDITVQLQGDGPMNLAVINGNNNQQMRGVARVQGEIPENADLKTLVGNGYVVITITPSEGERYQGVVGLEGDRRRGQCESIAKGHGAGGRVGSGGCLVAAAGWVKRRCFD